MVRGIGIPALKVPALSPEARRSVGPLIALSVIVGLLYLPTLRWTVSAWNSDPFFTHGLLVPPIGAYFAWNAWQRAKGLPKQHEGWGLAILVVALALLAYGRWRSDATLQAFSLVTLLGGLVVATQGVHRAKHFTGALVLLLFAIPFPFVADLSPYLQLASSNGASAVVGAAGMPVERDVFTITASGIRFEVAPLCSGLSSLMSLTFVAFVAAHAAALSPRFQALLTLSAIPLAFMSNLVRVVSTILVGVKIGPEAATQYFEGPSNVVLYLLALAPLLGMILWLRRRRPDG